MPGALWVPFDASWYLAAYPEAAHRIGEDGLAGAAEHYALYGEADGLSPNRFFDERFYRGRYPDIERDVLRRQWRSGFAHYCAGGWHDNDPHWLFSNRVYRERLGATLTRHALERGGYVNAYDHYLGEPEREGVSGSLFFDPQWCRHIARAHPGHFPVGLSLYAAYLALPRHVADALPVSPYFDPVWYLARYPEVGAAIGAGHFASALHHYLTNDTPRLYDPQAWFSEIHYAQANADVVPAIDSGAFRNGYDHFLRFGAFEGRSPHPDVALAAYAARSEVQADVAHGLTRDPYTRYLADIARLGGHPTELPPIDEHHAKQVYLRRAEALLPVLARQGLDFTCHETPSVSVIMVLFNQIALTMTTLASLRANFAGPIDLVLVDSGSHDTTGSIERYVRGARVLRFRHNIGYLDGCNAALADARADAVLYLNNDVTLRPGAVAAALNRLEADRAIGAVGAKIVRTNAELQEAGSIIWRDGTTYGYLRNDNPNDPQANFVRDVDYCSAAFLMVRTPLVRACGGFDPLFRPAYFEDTDLCIRILEAGYRIVYDPTVMIEHLEFGSGDAGASLKQMLANHRKLVRRHVDFLRYQQPSHHLNKVAARGRRGDRRRVLFIDDYVPLRQQGSGYVRSNDIVQTMARLGYEVTVFPIMARHIDSVSLFENFPETVEIIADQGIADLSRFLAERAGYYDAVWVGRTHNLARMLPILGEANRYLPARGLVLDTEVVATPRAFAWSQVTGRAPPEGTFEEALREEFLCAYHAQRIVAVTPGDAALIRIAGHDDVAVLGHMLTPQPSPAPFAARHGLLFVGAIHETGSPNHDSLEWFVAEVLPRLEAHLPADARVTIAGYVRPGIDLGALGENRRVDIVGPVRDLSALYNRHRVFIAPTRFAGGLPYKVHEAAAHGLPIVATGLLGEQLGWQDGRDLLCPPGLEAEAFASAIMRVYHDEALWTGLRDAALARVRHDCDADSFSSALDAILQGATT
ncbi:glycosyltransferase [Ameyamaea chiangmaiensis]|uniref:glycosyltransferase n=1 Tax=Ameyamaea chiangmaiensis TaxID=442969 RepID=UPI0029390499|nr:glycosyltransferase [Ameyamaea chiangmaiensis]